MSIQVQNITKYYGKQTALDNVSFEINQGEIVGFLGPNGAGKSTMMKIICAYLSANDGTVIVGGKNIVDNEAAVKQMIGYLPEHNPLYLNMYVKEFLNFMCGLFEIKNKKERIAEILSLTGLEKEQHKKISALSKGYRQRVGLAHAIIHDPEVLILDEPTTGLDPNQIIEIRELIQQIGKQKTVMLSTHIMQEVEAICDRVIIINQGKIVANETIEVLKSQQQNYLLEVTFEHDLRKELLTPLNVKNIDQISPNSFVLESSNPQLRQQLSKFALEQNNMIIKLNQKSKSLEEVFQHLTQ